MAEPVVIKVNGQRFEGWKKVDVRRGLDAMAGSFSLGITDRWPGHPEQWRIEAGQACQILIGPDQVLTGYIDAIDYNEDRESHPIEVSGRGKTSDLLDCSAIHVPGSWSGRTLEQIAGELVKPFGIEVEARGATGAPFARFSLNQGEAVHEALERMGRLRGVIFVESAEGALEIVTPGAQAAGFALEEGVNCLSVGFRNEATERYSDYLVKGNAGGREGPAARPKGAASDPGVPRYRPLLIVDGEQATTAAMEKRARWEATVRAAKAQTVRASVAGWRPEAESAGGGQVYRPDRMTMVRAPYIGVEQQLLIASVALLLDERGSRTEFELVRKEAYSAEPLEDPKPPAGRGERPPIGRRKGAGG